MEIIRAKTAGFCFGVDRAVKLTYDLLAEGRKVATLGPLIHNAQVVADLEAKGAVTCPDIDAVPDGYEVVIRSYGVPRAVYDKINTRGLAYHDATCPFVAKIHKIAMEADKIGALLLVALMLLVVSLLIRRKPDTEDDAIYFDSDEEKPMYCNYLSERVALLWMAIPICLLVLLCATPWWARTVAVFWTLIPLAIVALCVRRGNSKSNVAKGLLILAFLNCGLMAFSTISAATSYTADMKGHWERMSMAELPSEEDARTHNEYMKNYKTWNKLKGQGESKRIKKALWTKVENIVK